MSDIIHRSFADLSTMAKGVIHSLEAKVEAAEQAVEDEADKLLEEAEVAVGIEEPVEPVEPVEPEATPTVDPEGNRGA